MPLYSLKCGNCLQDNNVSAGDEPIAWTCSNCGLDNNSSLPRSVGVLVTDSTKAKSLLSAVQVASAKGVIQSRDAKVAP